MNKTQLIEKYGEEWYKRILEQQKEYRKKPEVREKHRESSRKYRENHADVITERRNTPENKEKARIKSKIWYETHKEYAKKRNTEYAKQHPEVKTKTSKKYRDCNKEKISQYNTSKAGRASHQAILYKRQDSTNNRGTSTITQKWILENIYTSKCIYCGCDDWKKLGCDRIDNNKPHTPDNVVPSCNKCNSRRGRKDFNQFLKECKDSNGKST